MRLSPSYQRPHLLQDLGPELPLLSFAAVVFFITILSVYLYAATQ